MRDILTLKELFEKLERYKELSEMEYYRLTPKEEEELGNLERIEIKAWLFGEPYSE